MSGIRYSFADLFAGCGGLTLGLLQAGLDGRFAIERDPMAFDTFEANFLDGTCPAGRLSWPDWLDKRAWDIEDLLTQHMADLVALQGKIDVLAGGPPCQGFSFAGRRVEGDPRNLLFKKYVEVVTAVRPRALILENVPGMRVAHGHPAGTLPARGAKSAKSFYDRLVDSLDEAGYAMHSELVDASRYGVPQKRLRLIAIGIRKDLLEWVKGGVGRAFDLLEIARIEQLRELGLHETISAVSAISDLEVGGHRLRACVDPASPKNFRELAYRGPRTAYQRLMHVHVAEEAMDSMRLARHRDDVRDRFAQILRECRQGVRMDDASRSAFGLKKHRIFPMAPQVPAPTITTLPDDILHYKDPRILTVRESARLQSFPDWFRFKGKFTTGGDRRTKECPRYTQVGNAVPPHLARALGKALTALLNEVEQRRIQGAAGRRRTRVFVTA